MRWKFSKNSFRNNSIEIFNALKALTLAFWYYIIIYDDESLNIVTHNIKNMVIISGAKFQLH